MKHPSILRLQNSMLIFTVDLKAKAGARTGSVPKKLKYIFGRGGVNDPLSEKFRNFVPNEFTMLSVHVLCSHFKEIGRHNVGETMRCFVTKKFPKCVFSPPFCAHLAEGAKSLQ